MKYLSLISNFGGLNTSPSSMNASNDTFTVMDDFMYWYSERNERSFKGLVKVPSEVTDLTYATEGYSRGIFQFFYDIGSSNDSYLLTARTNAGRTFTQFWFNATLMTDSAGVTLSTSPFHATFTQKYDEFRGLATAYFSNGNYSGKWFYTVAQTAIQCPFQDISATPINIAGTLTFNLTKTVTTSGTWPATLQKGSWLRLNSASPWEEVESITNTTTLVLRTFSINNTTSSTAQHSAASSYKPLIIDIWKDKLWGFNLAAYAAIGSLVGIGVVGTAIVGSSPVGLPNTLCCTETYSSATPYAFEDFTGVNTGSINVGAYGWGVGMANIGDYKICFKENEYTVFRYNDTLLPPIEPVKTFQYACVSHEAIQNVGDMVIYFTGKEVRATNGFQDVLISQDIDFDLRQRYYCNNANDFYGLTANDNALPTSVWDKTNNLYILFLTPRTPENSWGYDLTKRVGFIYDINAKKWIGKFVSYPIGHCCTYFNDGDGRVEYLYATSSLYSKYLSQHTGFNTDNVGSLETNDNWFESPQYVKQVKYLELWVHQEAGATTEYTQLGVNYFLDGVKALATQISQKVYPKIDILTSQTDAVQYQKFRFDISANCRYFRMKLQDLSHNGSNKCFALLNAIVGYVTNESN